ncbi:carbohydrate ABC transporter permease [Pseudonocardia sp. TRM90224]|uniref:carbohydrate ABC transporter permease n=1 Tax=Pseudonocardia sp. TRM90224 TaxID=2812678 RepID=UPI001E54A2B9|nr:sugar ABC transporter permease [Pseudonocardia sp. TRM90224]
MPGIDVSPAAGSRPARGERDPERPTSSRRGRGATMRRREAIAAYGFIAPWIVGFVIFMAVPMIISLVLSFTDYDGLRQSSFLGLDNYATMLADPRIRLSLLNTMIYAIMVVPATMAVALALAMLLSNVGRRSAGFFRTVFYLPEITPKVAIGVLFLLLLNGEVGVVDAALGVFGIDGPGWTTDPAWIKPGLVLMNLWSVGGTVVIYLAALQNVPTDLYEAAAIDGASAWQRFRRITLPMISPALFFTLIVQTIAALQTFDEAYAAFYGPSTQTGTATDAALFYLIYLFQQAFQFLHLGYASAMAWLLFVIIMVITAVQVRVSRRLVHYEGN